MSRPKGSTSTANTERNNIIYERALAGESFSGIGRDFNLSHEAVRVIFNKIIEEFNLDKQSENYWKELNNLREVLRMSRDELGKKIGCNKDTVGNILTAQKAYVKTDKQYRGRVSIRRRQISLLLIKEAKQRVEEINSILNRLYDYK